VRIRGNLDCIRDATTLRLLRERLAKARLIESI
jgi:hypothetical protein